MKYCLYIKLRLLIEFFEEYEHAMGRMNGLKYNCYVRIMIVKTFVPLSRLTGVTDLMITVKSLI